MRSFCDYLSMRYPQEFVQAISIGACSDRRDHYESFPILDTLGNRVTMAAALFTVTKVYKNMGRIGVDFGRDMAMANWDKAAEIVAAEKRALAAPAAETKESERRSEERAAKRDRLRDQPWRRGHA